MYVGQIVRNVIAMVICVRDVMKLRVRCSICQKARPAQSMNVRSIPKIIVIVVNERSFQAIYGELQETQNSQMRNSRIILMRELRI